MKKNQSQEKNRPERPSSRLDWHAPMLHELKNQPIKTGPLSGPEGSSGHGPTGSES